jgi:hypothetical protein
MKLAKMPDFLPALFRQQSCTVMHCRANWATGAVFGLLKSTSYKQLGNGRRFWAFKINQLQTV